jgi:hypothetical protein
MWESDDKIIRCVPFSNIISKLAAIQRVLELVEKLSYRKVTVLIHEEAELANRLCQ